MKKFHAVLVLAALALGTAATVSAAERSSGSSRSSYDPFEFRRAAENPALRNDAMKKRMEVIKRLHALRVNPPKPVPPRSPHQPPRVDDDDRGHGNNEDGDDADNPGRGKHIGRNNPRPNR